MGGPATNGDSGTARTPREGVHPETDPRPRQHRAHSTAAIETNGQPL